MSVIKKTIKELRRSLNRELLERLPIEITSYGGKAVAYIIAPKDYKKLEETKEENWRKKFNPPESVIVGEETPF